MLASFCGICGLQFQSNDTFCARCGAPRDTNVFDTTSLLASAPNAPTILNSNQPTFCINCGHPRDANVFPCPFCNSYVPTIATQLPIDQQMATDAPTPPCITDNLSQEQRYMLMNSDINPYSHGIWGQLVIDGSKKNPWSFKKEYFGNAGIGSNSFGCIATPRGTYIHVEAIVKYSAGIITIPDIDYRDIAVQVVLENQGYNEGEGSAAGIVCRAGANPDFALGLYRTNRNSSHFTAAGGVLDATSAYADHDLYSLKTSKAISAIRRKSCVLGIVAQGVYVDFYVDLIHIGRVHTKNQQHGSVGFFISGGYADFTNLKLWVKKL